MIIKETLFSIVWFDCILNVILNWFPWGARRCYNYERFTGWLRLGCYYIGATQLDPDPQ